MSDDRSMHLLIDRYFLGKPYGVGRAIQSICTSLSSVQSSERITVAMLDRPNLQPVPGCERLD